MMRAVLLLIFFLSLAFFGCRKSGSLKADRVLPQQSKSPPPSAAKEPATKIDADKLLSSSEIESVTGEPSKRPVTSAHNEAGFAIAQYYFQTTTPAKSIVITVTNRGVGPEAKEPRQFWTEKFHSEGNGAEQEGEEPQRKQSPPEKVEGVGDEAFWVESGSTGALYALQANSFIRVAIGGSDDKAVRIDKVKRLAQLLLKRLQMGPNP